MPWPPTPELSARIRRENIERVEVLRVIFDDENK